MAGLELLVSASGNVTQTERKFDSTIYEDLDFDEFIKSNPLEFNFYLSGMTK